jgi:gamma-glutamyltranspeptidase/glutathione hydrolase
MERRQKMEGTAGSRGVVVAPEARAAEAGASILRSGGSAIEAAVATAAALAVTYPHMTGIGGDAFWLVSRPGEAPRAILGCGRAGQQADLAFYEAAGCKSIPTRGPLAANTCAGAVSSWAEALACPKASRLKLADVLAPAIGMAREGASPAPSLVRTMVEKSADLAGVAGWADTFATRGDTLRLPRLARTLERLANDGLASFYAGALARDISADLAELGAPVCAADLAAHRAIAADALSTRLAEGVAWNAPPPTQGLASLLILALTDRLPKPAPESFAYVHGLVEATKSAFVIRDQHVGDPAWMTIDAQAMLEDIASLDAMAAGIDLSHASPWPRSGSPGGTTWFGAADADGCVVSVIQSIYFEFGSGLVLPRTGIVWQNRGSSFRLASEGWNALRPGRMPFHTLNPALMQFEDGRTMAYGTMGGEGQPQTQATALTRYARYGTPLAEAIAAPRWLLGRTWGDDTTALRIESDFDPGVVDALIAAGHKVQLTSPRSDTMGHAGALVRHADGRLEAASDPRCDGGVAWA